MQKTHTPPSTSFQLRSSDLGPDHSNQALGEDLNLPCFAAGEKQATLGAAAAQAIHG